MTEPPVRDLLEAPPPLPQIRLVFGVDGAVTIYGDMRTVREWCRRHFRDVTIGVLPGNGSLLLADRQGRRE